MLRRAEGREFDVQTCLFGIAFRAAALYLILYGITVSSTMLAGSYAAQVALAYSRPIILLGLGLSLFFLSGMMARAITRDQPIPMSDRRAWSRFGDAVAALGVAGLFALTRLNYLGYYAIAGSHAYVTERGWLMASAELLLIGGIGFVLLRYGTPRLELQETS